MKRKIIFQAFNWSINDILENLENIHSQGFNTVQVSPLQGTKQPIGRDWWVVYQPINYSIGNDLGTKEELTLLCSRAKDKGIDILVDCVLHHLGNETGNDLSSKINPEILRLQNLFHECSFINIKDYGDYYQNTHFSLSGLPALNLSNAALQEMQFNYLCELRDCGVSGARFDALKHMDVIGTDYMHNMKNRVGEDFIRNSYGEVIESPYQVVKLYQSVMKVGTDASVSTEDENLVLWVYSHDMELTFNSKWMGDQLFLDEYKILLDNYKGDILYYAREYEILWKTSMIKDINKKLV